MALFPQAKDAPDGGPGSSRSASAERKRFDLDLRDWIGHRVLARRGGLAPPTGSSSSSSSSGPSSVFCPGVVRGVYEGYSVSVLFDGEDQPLVYHEVLAPQEIDTIISDAVPTTNQVGRKRALV